MKKQNIHITNAEASEIRRLLPEWMEATISPADEAKLHTLLAPLSDSFEELPVELRNDARLLRELSRLQSDSLLLPANSAEDSTEASTPLSSSLPEIPEAYQRRINAALEKEFAQERPKATVSFRVPRVLWWSVACIAVICLAFGLSHHSPVNDVDESAARKDAFASAQPSSPSKPDPQAQEGGDEGAPNQVMASSSTLLPPKGEKSAIAISSSPLSSSWRKSSAKPSPAHALATAEVEKTGSFLSQEEEAQLKAQNYYVVDDQPEAEAIMASLLLRFQDNLRMESLRVSEITSRYQLELEVSEPQQINLYNSENDEKINI